MMRVEGFPYVQSIFLRLKREIATKRNGGNLARISSAHSGRRINWRIWVMAWMRSWTGERTIKPVLPWKGTAIGAIVCKMLINILGDNGGGKCETRALWPANAGLIQRMSGMWGLLFADFQNVSECFKKGSRTVKML
jgi:hypothetical protein